MISGRTNKISFGNIPDLLDINDGEQLIIQSLGEKTIKLHSVQIGRLI